MRNITEVSDAEITKVFLEECRRVVRNNRDKNFPFPCSDSDSFRNLVRYAAGYFDGEGTICLLKSHSGLHLKVGITSGDKASLGVFSCLFGGQVKNVKRHANSKRDLFGWLKTGVAAQRVLKVLIPYLVAKQEKAIAAFALDYSRWHDGPWSVSDDELQNRERVRSMRCY